VKEQNTSTSKDTWAMELYMLMTFGKIKKVKITTPKRVSLKMK
jgi:hypothetical protein